MLSHRCHEPSQTPKMAAMNEITVAVAQSIAIPGDLPRSVGDHARLTIRAAQQGARLVLFPELSLTGYRLDLTQADALAPDDARLRMLQQVADAHDIVIIAGAPIESSSGLHIGALYFSPRRPAVSYSKRFL